MFCATLFTHMGSQHPVGWFTGGLGKGVTDLWGPWQGLKEAWAGFGKNTALGGFSSGGALSILCHEGEEMGALSFPRQRAHLNPLRFEWERGRNTKTWGNYA